VINLVRILSLVFLTATSTAVFSLTCPYPSEIKYTNGRWVAPIGWYFDRAPEGQRQDIVGSFIGAEWQAITKGQSEGSVDWCHYAWKNHPEREPISVSWWGNPMFVKRAHLSVWTPLIAGKVYRCTSSIQNCSFKFTSF